MGNTAVGIAYLGGPRLRASLLAAADWIDTGTNFCSTFRAAAEAVRKLGPSALVAKYTPRSCLINDVTSAIGVNLGPGAWGIFYQIED